MSNTFAKPARPLALTFAVIGLAITAGPAPAQAPAEDKALGRPAEASSVEPPMPESRGACVTRATCAPSNVTDGDDDTRWSSEYSDPQWWQVDLGRPRLVDGLSLLWYRAHSAHYLVSTSLDGVNFITVADVSLRLSTPKLEELSKTRRLRDKPTFAASLGRYVRITSLERAPVLIDGKRFFFGISLREARVLGPPDDGALPGPPPPATLPPTQMSPFQVVDDDAPAFDTTRPGSGGSPSPPALVPRSTLALMSPFPTVRLKGTLTARGAAIDLLSIRAPRTATVRVRCRGRGCPKRVRNRRGSVRRVREMQRKLRAGVVLEVFVMQRGRYGKYTRFKIRKGSAPRRIDRCIASRSSRPMRCPVD